MKFVQPKVFILADTQINPKGKKEFLEFLNVPSWATDAQSGAEEVIEIAQQFPDLPSVQHYAEAARQVLQAISE